MVRDLRLGIRLTCRLAAATWHGPAEARACWWVRPGLAVQQQAGYSEWSGPPGREADIQRPTTPWVRSVISGVDLMRNPKFNKGLAFTEEERDRLYLRGLLPPAVMAQGVQAERALLNLRSKASDLDKHSYLASLHERNQRLFYHVLEKHIAELLPIVHMPTVGLYCQKYGLMFRSLPRGLFISTQDRGRVFQILKNWPERRVKAICLTDGEQVGSLGDLGVQAVGIPISKLNLYTACGGVPPSMCLPICIDAGTDNEELLSSPFYVGNKHKRVRGDAYYELLDELLMAARRRFGNTVLVHLQDMAHATSAKLLAQYHSSFPCFADNVQGLAATVLAGLLASPPLTGRKLEEHTFMFVGEGPDGAAVAEMVANAVASRTRARLAGMVEARQRMWLVDSGGLVTRERVDAHSLAAHKLPFCHAAPAAPDLLAAVRIVKPTVLIGISANGATHAFSQQVCEEMVRVSGRPIIMPLSQPTAEVAALDAYTWTKGQCVYASRERRTDSPPIILPDGRSFAPGVCEKAYVYPGLGLGTIMSRTTRLRDEMFVAAAEAVARCVTEADRAAGSIYPQIADIRKISAHVAKAVAQKAYDAGVATELPKPHDLLEQAHQFMYRPAYRRYR